MRLQPYTADGQALTESLECDPVVMARLGGPLKPAEIPAVHKRRLDANAEGGLWLKIIPEGSSEPVGTLGVWLTEWQGAEIVEAGWMLLPQFHGRGLGGEALGILLERLRADPRFDSVDAFPGADNLPSNALCRKFGFALLGSTAYPPTTSVSYTHLTLPTIYSV